MRAGVDDLGSGDFKGFACVVVPAYAVADLESSLQPVLDAVGLPEFHGKEFHPDQEPAYQSLATELKRVLKRSGEYASFHLIHESVVKEVFVDFATRVARDVLATVGHPGSDTTDYLTTKVGPLFWLVRELQALPADQQVSVEIDRERERDEYLEAEPVVLPGAPAVTAAKILGMLSRSYAKKQFPGGCHVDEVGFADSRNSMLVQVADFIANFGVAHVKHHLRTSGASRREETKAAIFQSLLEDRPPTEFFDSLRGRVVVTSENTLSGDRDANVRFQLTAS